MASEAPFQLPCIVEKIDAEDRCLVDADGEPLALLIGAANCKAGALYICRAVDLYEPLSRQNAALVEAARDVLNYFTSRETASLRVTELTKALRLALAEEKQ
ncbi:hypothetical protein [Aureimonas psammosilenae]|uniref:hypothetical protein n=1 Tax=Aureimonas psammosilenae TaxID=2495496 RepID=UPI001260D2A2|nr:hypothetical protein [Aureimonas psammosilenae]